MGSPRGRTGLALETFEGLTDEELLRVLVGTRDGVEELLSRYGAINELARLAPTELAQVLTPARAERVAAALELGRRAAVPRVRELTLDSAHEVYRYARPRMAHLTYEVFHVLLLDTKRRLVADRRVGQGGLASCALSPRDVFEPAIREAAPAVIFVHNHPSGSPEPSRDDVALTVRLAEAAGMLGITLVDHVVVADGGFASVGPKRG